VSFWTNFLNSLATRGGAIFILMVLSLTGFGITLHIIHHGEDSSMVAAGLVTTLGNFTGALLLALKGSSETTSTATVSPGGGATVRVSDASASTPNTTEPPKP
jgi:hypothetical protein